MKFLYFTYTIIICFSIVNAILLKSHRQQSMTVKFKKNDVQTICPDFTKQDVKNWSCTIQICPDSSVMKPSYKCFNIPQEQYNEWFYQNGEMQFTGKYQLDLECERIIDKKTKNSKSKNTQQSVSAQPEGGIKTLKYNCHIKFDQ